MENTQSHVLVVDEPGKDQIALVQTIKNLGYRVSEVVTDDDAMAFLKDHPVDLVVTEVMTPDINGWDLLTEIKRQFPKIHVVVMTGRVSDESEKILTELKGDGYLIKPVIPKRVRVLFRALLDPLNLDRDAEVVLVIADDTRRAALKDVLGDRGLEVFDFRDAKGCIRHIRLDPPEVFIIENDDGNTGLDLCRAIRSMREITYTPILLIASQPTRFLVERAIQLRINSILCEPFVTDEVGNRAIRLVQQADLRRKK